MELLCPQCLGSLAPATDRQMRCTVHGGEYSVLFSRDPVLVVEESSQAPAADSVPPALDASSSPPPLASPAAAAILAAHPPAGMRCVQHPGAAAAAQCQACGAYMCATCDFALPNGLHLCPACATRPQTTLGPKRKGAMIWSFVCAAAATLGFVLTFGYAAVHPVQTKMDQQFIGVLMMVFVLIPSIVGLGIGLGAIDRRHKNPASLWAATIWNGVILAVFVLLSVAGSFS